MDKDHIIINQPSQRNNGLHLCQTLERCIYIDYGPTLAFGYWPNSSFVQIIINKK